MSKDNDWLSQGLPTYHGGKDRTLARKMIDRLDGPAGFKTDQRTDADGTTTTVQTKGEMAPQITVTKTEDGPTPVRTFVFNEVGSTTGVIANRSGDRMKVVLYNYPVVTRASYKVGPANTSKNKKHWNDVWRLDYDKFLVNGKVSARSPLAVDLPTTPHQSASIPYLVNYTPPANGPTDRSALFVGNTEGDDYAYSGSPFGVAGTRFDGTRIDLVTPATTDTYFQQMAPGERIDASGDFHFYWMMRRDTESSQFISHHAVIRPVAGEAPLLVSNSESDSGYWVNKPLTISVTGTANTTTANVASCSFKTTYDAEDVGVFAGIIGDLVYMFHHAVVVNLGSGTGYYGTQLDVKTNQISCDDSYLFYPGTPLEMSLNFSISGDETWRVFQSGTQLQGVPPGSVWQVGSEGSWYDWVRISETNVTMMVVGLAPIYAVHCSVSSTARTENTWAQDIQYDDPPTSDALIMLVPPAGGVDLYPEFLLAKQNELGLINLDSYGNHHAPLDQGSQRIVTYNNVATSLRTDAVTLNLESNDYIFLDVDEEISLRLNAVYTYGFTHAGSWAIPITEQPMYGPPDTAYLTVKYILDVRGELTEFVMYDDDFTEAQIPFGNTPGDFSSEPVFHGYHQPGQYVYPVITPIMEQGKCAWLAYTTKAEEAAGATPEFYIDAIMLPDVAGGYHGYAFYNPWTFNPRQLSSLFTNYLAYWADVSPSGFYSGTLFGTPMRIQYAKGLSNPWPGKLGVPFTEASHVEISRI